MMAETRWTPLQLDGLGRRLVEVRDLLQQAAALAAATDLARARELSELVSSDTRAQAPVRVVRRARPKPHEPERG